MKHLLFSFFTLIAITSLPQSSDYIVGDLHGKCAGYVYINSWGKLIITGKVGYRMDDIKQNPLAYDFGEYHDSLAFFRMEPKGQPKKYLYGYMNEYFTVIIPATYKSASNFNNGMALVSDGDRSFYIDKTGTEISASQASNFRMVHDTMIAATGGDYDSISIIKTENTTRVYVRNLSKDEDKERLRREKDATKKKNKEDEEKHLEQSRQKWHKEMLELSSRLSKAQTEQNANQCAACSGTGVSGGGTLQCGSCGGSGGTSCFACGGTGRRYSNDRTNSQYCSSCSGSGKKTCSSCNGTGKKKVEGMRCSVCKGTGKKQ